MQIRDFLDALQVEGSQDYLLATVLEGEQQGAALLLRGGVPVFGGSSLLAAHLPALQACTATGVLSGFGVGGGTLLLVYLTAVAGADQHLAQGINLLYFLPAALLALPAHRKNGYLDTKALPWLIGSGLICAALAAWLSAGLEVTLLRKLFGGFLIVVGLHEIFSKVRS